MESLDRDIRLQILHSKVLDDLVHSRFARTIAYVSGLDDLTRSRGDIDNDSRTRRRESQELLHDVEGADDIGLEGGLEVCGGYVFARDKRVGGSDVRNQDVDLTNIPEN
jgi:hypothetical protein